MHALGTDSSSNRWINGLYGAPHEGRPSLDDIPFGHSIPMRAPSEGSIPARQVTERLRRAASWIWNADHGDD